MKKICCLPHSEMNEDKFLTAYFSRTEKKTTVANAAASIAMYMLYQQTSLMQRGLCTCFGTISEVYLSIFIFF